MLKKLQIQNYAIIDAVEINFSGKMNVITGETGAGKSILMGALALILGDRADSGVLLNRKIKCVVEGLFSTGNRKQVSDYLRELDLDPEEELIVRREIGSNGKSRAFVNDTPVTLEQLRKLSSFLVDLHQQFDSLTLGEAGFQREVLDALAGHASLLDEYRHAYAQWMTAKKTLALLQDQKLQFNKELDYNQYLYNELEEAAFGEEELENLEAELKLLINAEGIKTALTKIYYELKEGEDPAVQKLKSSVNQLQAFSEFTSLPAIIKRLQSAQIELQDIAEEIDQVNDKIQYDPKKIEEINERLTRGYKLLKKHGFKYTHELIGLQNELRVKLQAVLNMDESILNAEKESEKLFRRCLELGTRLSAGRQAQTGPLEEKVNRLLAQVGMPNARLKLQWQQADLGEYGMDQIDFLFDANKSNRFEPVSKVASGGELSRLMLCIKSLMAQSADLATLIFDEIDTGISGEAAKQVGILLKELSANRQVICITHQPQIAGKADAHFLVYKMIKGESIKTHIKLLGREERIASIAEMLGGEKPTAAALENAREMIAK